jgi:hypothetical protein
LFDPVPTLQSLVVVEALNNVLANPVEGDVEVGVDVVIISEQYSRFLLGGEENITIYLEHIGKLVQCYSSGVRRC